MEGAQSAEQETVRDGAGAGATSNGASRGVAAKHAAAESYPQQATEVSGKDKKKKKFPAKCEVQ